MNNTPPVAPDVRLGLAHAGSTALPHLGLLGLLLRDALRKDLGVLVLLRMSAIWLLQVIK